MRTAILLASSCASLAIVAACASSEEEAPPAGQPPAATVPDSGATEASTRDVDIPDTSLPTCSAAGWCITPFPDEDLVFRDIWPLEDRAFAIAESRTEGVKVLEWQKATDQWQYIDDQTQNGAGVGTFAGRIYAPSNDEVYFTVGPAYVYRGTRAAPPETKWTWTRNKLPDNIVGHPTSHDHGNPYYSVVRGPRVTFGVFGTSANEVVAYYSNTIFRRNPSDDTWSAVYTADDLEANNEHVFFTSAGSTGPDDLWLVGARDRTAYHCPLVVRKTAAGWDRVADGIVKDDIYAPCAERPGKPRIGGVGGGWLVDVQPVSATEYVALHDAVRDGFLGQVMLTRIRVVDDGYSFEQSEVPVKIAQESPIKVMTSLWRGQNENWFTSWGLVLRGNDDGSNYSVSTLSRGGGPVDAPLYRIRGTSTQNLWAIGARYAYHKTTP
jgi:hypothetical protein